MIPTVRDPCSYFLFRNGELIGIKKSYADDLLYAGDDQLRTVVSRTIPRFEKTKKDDEPIKYAGIHIYYTSDHKVAIDQLLSMISLAPMRSDATFKEISCMRIRLD